MLSSHLVFCLLASPSASSPPHCGLCPAHTEAGIPLTCTDESQHLPAHGLASPAHPPEPALRPRSRSFYSPTTPELPQQFGQSWPPSQPEQGPHRPSAWTRPGAACSSEEAVPDAVVPTGFLPRIRPRAGRRLGSWSDFRPLRWKTDLLCRCSPDRKSTRLNSSH